MIGESRQMMKCRLYTHKPSNVTITKVRTEMAGHVARNVNDRTVKKKGKVSPLPARVWPRGWVEV